MQGAVRIPFRLSKMISTLTISSVVLGLCLAQMQVKWPIPGVGEGTDNCEKYPCTEDSTFPPPEERISPNYPKKFTCHVQGFLVYPFTIPTPATPHLEMLQDAEMLYDYDKDVLLFENKLKLWRFPQFDNIFLHTGQRMYAKMGPICFCTNIEVGILKYDAFSDAQYLGRYKKFIEFFEEERLVDHYLKGPHHLWADVETGKLIRAWQPTNGLQVYTNWRKTADYTKMAVPETCIKYKCEDKYENGSDAEKLIFQDK
jgi:hypothetical protein